MHIGTNPRIGELALRYGHQSQRAPLDCTSSRRSTVMRALLWATGVTTGYQRDSSSKRPMFGMPLLDHKSGYFPSDFISRGLDLA